MYNKTPTTIAKRSSFPQSSNCKIFTPLNGLKMVNTVIPCRLHADVRMKYRPAFATKTAKTNKIAERSFKKQLL